MDLITHIRTFAEVVRAGSFSGAARGLHVVPSVVAKRIGQLERELGTRLFERTTRKVALTEAGESFHAKAMEVVANFEDLVHTVERDEGKLEGHIRVMAPTTLAIERLGPVFRSFLAEHPRISIELSLVGHSASPAERGFDIAVSGRAATYEGVVDIPLCPVKPLLCAAPSCLDTHAPLAHPRELANQPCLVFSATGNHWRFHSSRGVQSVEVRARLLADDNRTLLEAAIAGLGYALLPAYVASEALAQGRLREVLPRFAAQENWFKAYVPRRRLKLARVKALVLRLEQALAPLQGQSGPHPAAPS